MSALLLFDRMWFLVYQIKINVFCILTTNLSMSAILHFLILCLYYYTHFIIDIYKSVC